MRGTSDMRSQIGTSDMKRAGLYVPDGLSVLFTSVCDMQSFLFPG